MVKRDFNEWLSGFRPSIADYGFYINFDKVYRNVDDIKVELNILNSLIGSHNIEEEFRCVLSRYPEVLQCIPILLAVRASEIYCQDDREAFYLISTLRSFLYLLKLIWISMCIL